MTSGGLFLFVDIAITIVKVDGAIFFEFSLNLGIAEYG